MRQGQKEQLLRLSELSGVPTEALRNAANIPIGSLDYMLSGEQMTRKTLVQSETRVCPSCVLEDAESGVPIGRVEWQIKAYRICHRHQIAVYTLPETDEPNSRLDFQRRLADHWPEIVERATKVRDSKANYPFVTNCCNVRFSTRQLRTHEKTLLKHGLIERRTAANGSRHGGTGLGLVLTPIIERFTDLLSVRETRNARYPADWGI